MPDTKSDHLNSQLVSALHNVIPEADLMGVKIGQRIKYQKEDEDKGWYSVNKNETTIQHISQRGGRWYLADSTSIEPASEEWGKIIKHSSKERAFYTILGLEPEFNLILWALKRKGFSPFRVDWVRSDIIIGFTGKTDSKILGRTDQGMRPRLVYQCAKSAFEQMDTTKEWIIELLRA